MENAKIIIPVLLALNEGLKKSFKMPSKFAVVVNWIGGILLNVGIKGITFEAVIEGFLIGSAAGGIYDIGKLRK